MRLSARSQMNTGKLPYYCLVQARDVNLGDMKIDFCGSMNP